MENTVFNTNVYFAAANGYDGFRSNFDSVFSPNKLKKLFILKGGPGTGKSTLMRTVKERMRGLADVTEILCSSDTSSLDGLLIKYNGVTVGIADGTAPHIIEPRYPGAVEEIVILGDGFNYKDLMRHSEEIIKLSGEKGSAYKKAYACLKAAGDVHKCIDIILSKNGVYKEAEDIAGGIIVGETVSDNIDVKCDFLHSAFSKDGYTRKALPNGKKRVIGISADGICEYCVMGQIVKKLTDLGAIHRIYQSPLSAGLVETVETDTAIYTVMNSKEINVDRGVLFVGHSNEYERYKRIYDSLLSESQGAFLEASVNHFKLEDIYSSNISFEKNDIKVNAVIEKINQVFNK